MILLENASENYLGVGEQRKYYLVQKESNVEQDCR